MMSFREFVTSFVRQRRISWILLSILYTTAVWSWTSQRIISVPLAVRTSTSFVNPTEKVTHYSGGRIIRGNRSIQLSNPGQLRPTSTASFSKSSLLFSDQEDQEVPNLAINDSDLINSLIRARTTREVEITLRKSLPLKTIDNVDFFPASVDGVKQTNHCDEDNDTGEISFSSLSLNATAATLRRMAHISIFEARSELVNNNEYKNEEHKTMNGASENRTKLQKKMIASLLEAIGIKLMSHRSSLSPLASSSSQINDQRPGVYPLSDVLQALAVLAPDDTRKKKMKPFAILIVEFLNTHETSELYRLGPIRLVQCLQAITKLEIDHPSLYNKICQRLLKPDAVSKIPPRFLAHGLSALATFQTKRSHEKLQNPSPEWELSGLNESKNDDENDDVVHKDTMRLSRSFMRRLRKQKVAGEASTEDMCRALVATRDLLDLGAMTNMEDEAAMFGFTGLRTILEIRKTAQNNNSTSSSSQSLHLNPTQVTNMITSWASLSDQRREDTVIEDLLQICMDDEIIKGCSVGQLERIIQSIRKLNVANHAEVTRCVGERLLILVQENESSTFEEFYPTTINEIIRWPVLVHRRNKTVMEPFVTAASHLFSSKSFLERSSVKEIANFLWFLSIARSFDEEILLNIGQCLMEDEMVDSCSPKIASRILATFTSLVVSKEKYKSESLMELKQDLFYNYGGHLLSSKLSPAETSSALYAYAKANYVQDKGVFDHLVDLLSSSRHICSSRQLSQTLWSCGKMIAWERQEMGLFDDENAEMQSPPYLKNALSIAKELSERAKELTPADVAQIFWGIGRLEIQDDEIMSVFANRTVEICSSMNSVEVSNVLWGLAKSEYSDGKLIGSLSERLAEDDFKISSPRVAASILFSLGRLRWKDEILFRKLSSSMIDQIENVNAQSIANTLWAFRAVRMRPPRQLLDTWAVTRLGLVPAIGPMLPIDQPEID
mmetsp:Transcript_28417/g.59530  ORF Transcript_28417/g.59530 Transcript_28417/m.59530 type:complete len:952 (+) Transcript_28417:98-2953(+)